MAVSGSLKIPPPPTLAINDPAFNRWLLEVTAVLAAAGGIDPTQIQGWNELVAQVAANTGGITALQNSQAVLQSQINANTASINTLGQRHQVFDGTGGPAGGLGADGDWYYNRSGGVGARLYIKVLGAWVAQAI